jgi:hypothetical protein
MCANVSQMKNRSTSREVIILLARLLYLSMVLVWIVNYDFRGYQVFGLIII